MARRWNLKTAALVAWYLLLSFCAGYGLFWLAYSLGLDSDLAAVIGGIGLACCVTIFDRQLPRSE